jgi:hypothetical protein
MDGSCAWMRVTVRHTVIALAALGLTLLAGAPRAEAARVFGSPDAAGVPEGFACEKFACPAGVSVGLRQLALLDGETEAEEPGVLTSARVNGKRLRGAEQPRIAVLRPASDGIGVTVGPFAPVPVVSRDTALHGATDLHLPVEPGDSIGLLLPAGQVDLGVRTRPQPDGAVQLFTEPCGPCSMEGGTGRELMFAATVEPDDDQDRLGDESQDPDLGLGNVSFAQDEGDDWFDELEEDEFDEPFARRQRGELRLLGIDNARNGDPIVKLRTPGRGVVSGTVTTSGGRWDRGIPRTIGVAEDVRTKRAGRVRVRLRMSAAGQRMLGAAGRQRAVVVVSHRTRSDIKVAMRRFRQ